MYGTIKQQFQADLDAIKESGLYKNERVITSKQGAEINTLSNSNVLNFCANNYLGLSSDESVIQAGIDALNTHGFGLSSVRFICGTQDIHKALERKTAEFLGMEDCILYAAAFDANGGLFEPLLSKEDAIISDELNHASIIDGIRLCKAQRFRYLNSNMEDLEAKLKEASGARRKLIVTDGSFSMDGRIAPLDKICDLADKYDALVMIDECHSTGFIGKTGRGVHEYYNVMDRVDIITGTYGKALGGASGGFTAARKEIVDILRQHSRPYLFSNTLAPAIVGATLKVFDIISNDTTLRDKLEENTTFFRTEMTKAGFDIIPGIHPIVPIMLYDAKLSQTFAKMLLEEGIYVIGFFYPVVPKGKARIRVQLSAAHEKEHIQKAIDAFIKVGKQLEVI
ncbi:glycine C-acetyltransferase [Jejuia pallidilutea]|uniref:2-amino-3-ketobutyrate coenzyme A ligase n=1 Tax=Jejuia pallidilutea TaxID=504487 RepID=A0A090W8H5_9FLAO|nr:glycine C-acetyltransferase [Jejuia pallidilutea]PQV47915.1 2-amino-3-ketobutyrate coenzyme A ligase [Jejuia pallidilutea]GAL67792.1 2-amino-3-ketobutyrate coenzyme A ligase [Jejuia pallidilutea]GAL73251.1 2-amino-3-ketobutyrate coenzyme A ligase [Jejuia pallidilutea]GAL90005.1 2-amino-3-ketobutyrate coenzyme A ligase [Jejuia pallidilutea]